MFLSNTILRIYCFFHLILIFVFTFLLSINFHIGFNVSGTE